jgi:hypothetical protein
LSTSASASSSNSSSSSPSSVSSIISSMMPDWNVSQKKARVTWGGAHLHHLHAHLPHSCTQLRELDELVGGFHYLGAFLECARDLDHCWEGSQYKCQGQCGGSAQS